MPFMKLYNTLLTVYGHQEWWPSPRDFKPKGWEIIVGAILTQNVNWKNVEKALKNLQKAGITSIEDMIKAKEKTVAELIRPSGFYNQKTKRLKNMAEFVNSFGDFKNFKKNIKRDDLLAINGIGSETADVILLYVCSKPSFVVDMYTKRLVSRLGITKENDYETIRKMFMDSVKKDFNLYKEFHALIVEHSKRHCKKKPECDGCPVNFCKKRFYTPISEAKK